MKTPVEREEAHLVMKIAIGFAIGLGLVSFYFLDHFAPDRPDEFKDIEQQFKYGSIGSDTRTNGLPREILRVLPQLFPEYLPTEGPRDYTAFGFIQEPGQALPIGFSKRRQGIDLTGINCAACHTGVYRETSQSNPEIVFGMPSNTVDLQAFFEFLARCAEDERFTPQYIIPAVYKNNKFNWVPLIDDYVYGQAILATKAGLLQRAAALSVFLTEDHPRWGPGRVDTFNPYKVIQFASYYRRKIPREERFGTSDFPSIWNQKPREGMQLHWDGNNTSVRERNISAALGAGATRETVDLKSVDRIREWFEDRPAPKYPFPTTLDNVKSQRGQKVYEQYCASCHAFGGTDVGKVQPIESIMTDPGRLNSYTETVRKLQMEYTSGFPWAFRHFEKTNGYANQPLDGIWARAPYLHNGSVPTIGDLLKAQPERPKDFYIGHGVMDQNNLGIRGDVDKIGDRTMFKFDTALPGNGNAGHSGKQYGTELLPQEKADLIEYLKTL